MKPNAALTVNFTDPTAFGTDENPYKYFSIRVNGKRWNSADGSAALQKLIDDALQGSGGQAGGSNLSNDIGFKINAAADKALILTNTNIYGAQKLAGFAAGEMTELTALTVLGRLTGTINIAYNIKQFSQNPSTNWWNGVEAVGQVGAMTISYLTGIEEIELIYNASTLTIDETRAIVNKYNQDHP